MKQKLNIAERVALLNILPPEGNLVTLKIIRELKTDLSFSEEEVKRFKIKANPAPGGLGSFITWDSDFTKETKEVEIGNVAKDIIVEQLKALESQKRLRMETLDLYEKFVVEDQPKPPQN